MTTQDGGTSGGLSLVYENGPAPSLKNILLLGDGYLQGDLPLFEDDCWAVVQRLASEPWHGPTLRYRIFRQNVWSSEEGASVDGSCGPAVTRKTYFDATYGGGGLCRILEGTEKTAKDVAKTAGSALAKGFKFSRVVVLVNSPTYGGSCGGAVTWVPSRNADFTGLLLHELGHAMELHDEYDYYEGCDDDYDQGGYQRPVHPNLDNRHTNTKWEPQRNTGPGETIGNPDCQQCLPEAATAGYAADIVGAFEGGGWYRCGTYRPSPRCRMKDLNHDGFCEVCREHIVDFLT